MVTSSHSIKGTSLCRLTFPTEQDNQISKKRNNYQQHDGLSPWLEIKHRFLSLLNLKDKNEQHQQSTSNKQQEPLTCSVPKQQRKKKSTSPRSQDLKIPRPSTRNHCGVYSGHHSTAGGRRPEGHSQPTRLQTPPLLRWAGSISTRSTPASRRGQRLPTILFLSTPATSTNTLDFKFKCSTQLISSLYQIPGMGGP